MAAGVPESCSEMPDIEESPLKALQVCRALTSFDGTQEGDLSFREGEDITILQPSEVLFWYKARNSSGVEGLVPRTFLKVVSEKANDHTMPEHIKMDYDYLFMKAANQDPSNDPAYMEFKHIKEKEKKRRLPVGTLVIATCHFDSQVPGDLSFKVYDEMSLLYPKQDLCWYYAQKTDSPEEKGAIPVTHVRLVYMSDDDDDGDTIYNAPVNPAHDQLYDDVNDFISQSGWFSHHGLPHGKVALKHVIARKAGISYDEFVNMEQAVYLLDYRHGEKLYVGSGDVLSDTICKHFENFGKKREDISSVDDELCHHTDSTEWEVRVWTSQPNDLEFDCAKKIIEQNALSSKDTQIGLNDKLHFSTMDEFERFWEWFSPD